MISLPYREALAAILFCCVSIVVPYCFADRDGALTVTPILSVEYHIVISTMISLWLFGAFLVGWSAGKLPKRPTLWLDGRLVAYRLVLWAACTTLAAQALLVVIGLLGYVEGGIIAARTLAAIDGIGVIVRLSFVAACLLCLFEGRTSTVRWVLVALLVLSILRAVVFSERTAILELIVTILVAARRGAVRINFGALLLVAVCGIALFSWIQDVRTSQFDASKAMESSGPIETAFRVYASYYGDVQNKFYLIANDVLRFPMTWVAEPFYRLVGEPFPNTNVVLQSWQRSTSYINPALNNPGGLAQDASDLGLGLGLVWSALKMFACAFVIVRSRTSAVALALAPIAYLQIIEFPRFNYAEQAYGFYLGVAAVMLAVLVRGKPVQWGAARQVGAGS